MGIVSDLIATVRSTFRIKQATLDASGLTAPRTFILPDVGGTLALTGGGGSQEVFVQDTRPVTAGPWMWWETDASGNLLDLVVNDGA